MTDQEFLQQIEACTLPPQHFNHMGHMRLAWIYLQRRPYEDAVADTCATIRRYAASLGATAKFHHTVTVAVVRLMAAGGAQDVSLAWRHFIERNAALAGDARALLALHYSPGVLASDAARQSFVGPDRQPLP